MERDDQKEKIANERENMILKKREEMMMMIAEYFGRKRKEVEEVDGNLLKMKGKVGMMMMRAVFEDDERESKLQK